MIFHSLTIKYRLEFSTKDGGHIGAGQTRIKEIFVSKSKKDLSLFTLRFLILRRAQTNILLARC